MKTFFVNRNNTNERVIRAANDKLAVERYQMNITREEQNKRKIRPPKKDFWGIRKGVRPLSEDYEYLRNKQLAKIIFKPVNDPLRKIIFKNRCWKDMTMVRKDMVIC